MADALEIARTSWGTPAPDWIEQLATACNASSQRHVAERLRVSAGLISQVLRAKYPGDMDRIESAVRGAYMAATVTCPALGRIPTNECQEWQRSARDFKAINSFRVRMYRACRGCPRSQKESK